MFRIWLEFDFYSRPRPKSDYGFLESKSDRSQTLPRNYLSYSAPKPFELPATSKFQQKRKTAFANKRNMWENMAQEKKEQPVRSNPQHLSALLKNDNPHADDMQKPTTYSHSEHSMSASQDSSSSMELSPRQDLRQQPQVRQPDAKQNSNNNRNTSTASWLANVPGQGKSYAPVSPPAQVKAPEPVRNEPVVNGHYTEQVSQCPIFFTFNICDRKSSHTIKYY